MEKDFVNFPQLLRTIQRNAIESYKASWKWKVSSFFRLKKTRKKTLFSKLLRLPPN